MADVIERTLRFAETSGGQRVAYMAAGSGPALVRTAPWIVPIEDMTDRQLAELTPPLQQIAYDHLGIGLSDREVHELSLDAMVGELEAVVEAMGLDRFMLWGSSQGGPTAIAYAHRHPERVSRLVLYGTWARGGGWENRDTLDALVGMVRVNWEFASRMMSDLFAPEAALSSSQLERQSAWLTERVDPAIAARYMELFRDTDVRELLPEITAPTLVLHRRGDRVAPFEAGRELASLLPNATFVALDGANHAPQPEEGPILRDAALDFLLAEVAPPSPAPGGFQTVMFTDLEASTALTQRLGDEGAQELLRGHNTTVRGALGANGGREVKHTGDGIMASFPSAVAAVAAALQVQRELAGGEVRVRIGLNAGEPIAEDDDLFGTAVQLAARVTDRAEPGQVLVTRVVADLCAGKMFRFSSIGGVSMKGFDEAVELFEVRVGGAG